MSELPFNLNVEQPKGGIGELRRGGARSLKIPRFIEEDPSSFVVQPRGHQSNYTMPPIEPFAGNRGDSQPVSVLPPEVRATW